MRPRVAASLRENPSLSGSPGKSFPRAMRSMTGRVFVDSNVLIYARDVVELEKQRRAAFWLRHLWDTEAGRLSYQLLAESYSVLMAKRKLHGAQARAYLKDFLAW